MTSRDDVHENSFAATNDKIDFESFAFETEDNEAWQEFREPDADCTARGVKMMQWLATRPESEIAVVTHSSYLRHLFGAFGQNIAKKDKEALHRTVCLVPRVSISLLCLLLFSFFFGRFACSLSRSLSFALSSGCSEHSTVSILRVPAHVAGTTDCPTGRQRRDPICYSGHAQGLLPRWGVGWRHVHPEPSEFSKGKVCPNGRSGASVA